MNDRPQIDGAPGITWKPRKYGWECRWHARTDLIERGYDHKSTALWRGATHELTEIDIAFIRDRATAFQARMLVWANGGVREVAGFIGSLGSLVECYLIDPDSPYRKKRFRTRRFYDKLCSKILKTVPVHVEDSRTLADYGLEEINARLMLRLHEQWAGEQNRKAMAHATVGMLRTLCTFGKTILESAECARISSILHDMKFSMPKPRDERLLLDHAMAVCKKAHEIGEPSIALAQAIQFELMLRQKDVIGEWIPITEPGISDVLDSNNKWLRGIRWEEIDDNLILRHVTSKRGKPIECDLKLSPLVRLELDLAYPGCIYDEETLIDGKLQKRAVAVRSLLPASGPVVIRERRGIPWYDEDFRRHWRKIANLCAVPKTVRNMDSRAGAITEATEAGADLEHVKHAATHSNIAMTQRYSRGAVEKTASVMKLRVAARNKDQTD